MSAKPVDQRLRVWPLGLGWRRLNGHFAALCASEHPGLPAGGHQFDFVFCNDVSKSRYPLSRSDFAFATGQGAHASGNVLKSLGHPACGQIVRLANTGLTYSATTSTQMLLIGGHVGNLFGSIVARQPVDAERDIRSVRFQQQRCLNGR